MVKNKRIFLATIQARNKIYIPKEIREIFNIKIKNQVIFYIEKDRIYIKKVDDEFYKKITGEYKK